MNLTAKIFNDEEAAREHIEASRWGERLSLPALRLGQCHAYGLARRRPVYFLCRDCRDKFTCRTGTVMERSHVPLHKRLLALHLMASSKKGISALQLQRNLGLGSARQWFLAMRCREAMGIDPKADGPLGGPGETVEADATGRLREEQARQRALRGHVRGSVGKQVVHTRS